MKIAVEHPSISTFFANTKKFVIRGILDRRSVHNSIAMMKTAKVRPDVHERKLDIH